MNPFPDKDRESKTWLSENQGPIVSLKMLVQGADYFGLRSAQALTVLGEVYAAVSEWRRVAVTPEVGLRPSELSEFEPAFEHAQMREARSCLA